jgi:hypothetical protein
MSELPPPTWPYQPSFGLRRIAGVGTALSVMMFIAAGLAALAAFARFNRYSVVQDVMDGKVDSFSSTVADADDMVATFAGMLGFAGIAVFVLLIIWTYKNVANMRDLGYPARGSNGMAIGGFFIPIANIFIPYRYFNDIARYLMGRGYPSARYSKLPLWWWLYIGGVVVSYVLGGTEQLDNPTLQQLSRAEVWGAVGMGMVAISLVLGALTVRNMTNDASA